MHKLDHLKEEIGYFKFWLGIVVLTDISVLGWVISAVDGAGRARIILAATGIAVLSFCAAVLHRGIERRMLRIKEL
jgi:hypothetical protein